MKPHDQFAKNYLEELLSPLGTVETSQIDVFFSADSRHNSDYLGRLERIAPKTLLI
jgi:hypothetical protein